MPITEIQPAVITIQPRGARGAAGVDGAPGDQINYNTTLVAQAATISILVMVIRTGGYAAPGDRGHGFFTRVASVAVTSFGFQSADGAWWQYAESKINVLAMGADPTGTLPAAGIINQAISIVKTFKGVVRIPAGNYDVSGGIDGTEAPDTNGGFTIEGEGITCTYLRATSGANAILDLTGSSAVTVKDLWIDAPNGAGVAYGVLLAASLTHANNVIKFENVVVSGWFTQVPIYTYHSSDGMWDHCQVANYLPGCVALLVHTSTNFLGAHSDFTDIATTTAGQAGDWTYTDFQLHDISVAYPGQSSVIPLLVYGHHSPIKFVGGVIAGMISQGHGGMVTIDGVSPGGLSFLGVQFYGDTGAQSDYVFYNRSSTVTGIVVQGCDLIYNKAVFSGNSGVTFSGLNVTGNFLFAGQEVGNGLFKPFGGQPLNVVGSILDAQGFPIDLGAGTLSHSVVLRPGTITGTQSSNGIF